ncbi:MAG: glycosidase, partial [Patescibacteria group bacterium]|nr:glycosidase [Patescibacteria group bacterium]
VLIGTAPSYILQPTTDYEREGLVPNVTFPEGAVIVGDELFVYYGAADTVTGLAKCKLNDLLGYIESFRK